MGRAGASVITVKHAKVCCTIITVPNDAGIRMGKMIAKIFVIKLLAAYRFEPVSAAELEFENYGITLHVRGGIPMRIAHR